MVRFIKGIAFILLFMPLLAFADLIQCGDNIYNGVIEQVIVNPNGLVLWKLRLLDGQLAWGSLNNCEIVMQKETEKRVK